MIGYLDKVIRPLVLILSKLDRSVKTFIIKDKNNTLMSFHINNEKLLEKQIEELKNIELNALPVYGNRKKQIGTYGDKVYTNFCGLNIPEDDIKCKFFTVFSIDFLLVYESEYYLYVYLDNCLTKL